MKLLFTTSGAGFGFWFISSKMCLEQLGSSLKVCCCYFIQAIFLKDVLALSKENKNKWFGTHHSDLYISKHPLYILEHKNVESVPV